MDVYTSSGTPDVQGTTDANGDYTITALAPGSYAVCFQDTGYALQCYNDQTSPSTANDVTVTSSATTSGIDAVLQSDGPGGGTGGGGTGSISGNVTAAGTGPGRQLLDITIEATDPSPAAGQPVSESACSDASGNYTIPNLPSGSYAISFMDAGSCLTPDSGIFEDLSYGALVSVTAGSTATGIDGALSPSHGNGLLLGTVTLAASGAPVANGFELSIYHADGTADGTDTTSFGPGQFLFPAPTGSYKLEFGYGTLGGGDVGGDPFWDQFDGDQSSLAAAGAVTVTAGQTTGIGSAALQPPGEIVGTLTNAVTHQPLADATLLANDTTPGANLLNAGGAQAAQTETDGSGQYTMPVAGVATGPGETNSYTVLLAATPTSAAVTLGTVTVTSGSSSTFNASVTPVS